LNLFIECGPIIHEEFFSGIPNVNANLVRMAISKYGIENTFFFHGNSIINPQTILDIIKENTNKPRFKYEKKDNFLINSLSNLVKELSDTVGIYTNSRHGNPRIFNIEYQIFHDLTTLITPEFHNNDTIRFHADVIRDDISKLDYAICVSSATAEDLNAYLNLDFSKILVSHLGGGRVDNHLRNKIYEIENIIVEPYILMVGTIEPRKNHDILFRFLKEKPEILDNYKIVIIGRDGWNLKYSDLLKHVNHLSPARLGNIIRLGYVDSKILPFMYNKAEFSIFASHYEGFGLPVIESMSFGCPILASYASSIPEVGGEWGVYFDPLSLESFSNGFKKITENNLNSRSNIRKSVQNWAGEFSWERFAEVIFEHIEKRLVR